MKLWELSGQSDQSSQENAALRAVVINEMRGAAPMLNFAEFYQMTGNADTPLKAATATGGASRAINADYSTNKTAPAYGAITLKILGDKIETDIAYERRGPKGSLENERTRQLVTFSQALGRYLQDQMINGATSATDWDGLKAAIAAGQVLKCGGSTMVDGFKVALGNDNAAKESQQIFKESVDELIASVIGGASCLIVPPKGISRMSTIGMQFVQKGSIDAVFADQLGIYNGVPVVNAGYGKDGSTAVIPLTETLGGNTDCASFYAVRFGEKENVTFATNVGVQVKDLGLVTVLYTTLVDFDTDMVILNAKAAWRLQGIRL